MKPKRIFLIRHGESEGQVNKSIYAFKPDYALKLTNVGHTQAFRAGQALAALVPTPHTVKNWWFTAELKHPRIGFYCSSYFRAQQTMEGLIRGMMDAGFEDRYFTHNGQTRIDVRLREQEWSGSLRGAHIDYEQIQRERDGYGHFYYRFHGGESCADVYDRQTTVLDTLYRDFEKPDFPASIAIVSHGMTIRVLLMRWLKFTVGEFELLRNPNNCQNIVLELQTTGPRAGKYALKYDLERYNEPSHPYQL